MPSYKEGTRQWAEEKREQALAECLSLLNINGFGMFHPELQDISMDDWVKRSRSHGAVFNTEAAEDWDAYRYWKAEYGAMCEYVKHPPVADDGDPTYSTAELEAAGQGGLF